MANKYDKNRYQLIQKCNDGTWEESYAVWDNAEFRLISAFMTHNQVMQVLRDLRKAE